MRAALLAVLLASAAPAAAAESAAGLRVLYRRASDGARLIQNGTVAPEFFGEARGAGSLSAFELAVGGSNLSHHEAGRVTYVSGGSGTPTSYDFRQSLTVMPTRFTYKYGPGRPGRSWHVGAGMGAVLGLLTRSLTFGLPQANADFAAYDYETLGAFELHLQAGADWVVWDRFTLGAFGRWSYAPSDAAVYSGYQGSGSSGHRFARAESLVNLGGLDLGAAGSWRF